MLNELIKQNYEAVVARGLINGETDFFDFMDKLDEETKELAEFVTLNNYIDCQVIILDEQAFKGELIDCISVLLNMAEHYKVDVLQGLKDNIKKNQERAKNGKHDTTH